jgi:hypothetical protein
MPLERLVADVSGDVPQRPGEGWSTRSVDVLERAILLVHVVEPDQELEHPVVLHVPMPLAHADRLPGGSFAPHAGAGVPGRQTQMVLDHVQEPLREAPLPDLGPFVDPRARSTHVLSVDPRPVA